MATSRKPTNTDLYDAVLRIEKNQGRLEEKVDAVHEQAKKTNGRVTSLEGIENRRSAVQEYKDSEGKQMTPTLQETNTWSVREKTFITIIMVLLAVVVALTGAKVIGT